MGRGFGLFPFFRQLFVCNNQRKHSVIARHDAALRFSRLGAGIDRRLKARWNRASESAAKINAEAVQASIDLAKEKTQYFEKIALGSGVTIAVVVSFVGAHSGKLQPPWLLRSALVSLALAMIGAMYRNWEYQFYVIALWYRKDFAAKLERECCKRDYLAAFANRAVWIEDGEQVDAVAFAQDYNDYEKKLEGSIAKSQTMEDRAFKATKYVEFATLAFGGIGVCLLIWVAWRNF